MEAVFDHSLALNLVQDAHVLEDASLQPESLHEQQQQQFVTVLGRTLDLAYTIRATLAQHASAKRKYTN